jgi:hypothetical protein
VLPCGNDVRIVPTSTLSCLTHLCVHAPLFTSQPHCHGGKVRRGGEIFLVLFGIHLEALPPTPPVGFQRVLNMCFVAAMWYKSTCYWATSTNPPFLATFQQV